MRTDPQDWSVGLQPYGSVAASPTGPEYMYGSTPRFEMLQL